MMFSEAQSIAKGREDMLTEFVEKSKVENIRLPSQIKRNSGVSQQFCVASFKFNVLLNLNHVINETS